MVKRILASGQSNMDGRGIGGPDWSTISPRVRVWNSGNPLSTGGYQQGTAFVPVVGGAAPFHPQSTRKNLAAYFCDKLARANDEDVYLTLISQGELNINEWVGSANSTGPMLQRIFDNWTASGQGPADVFLWHQGEQNVNDGTTFETYQQRFNQMIQKLKDANVINNSTIIVLGGLGENTSARIQFNANYLRALSSEAPARRYASSAGLLPLQDASHFTGDQLYALGTERFWSAYLGVSPLPVISNLRALVNEGGTPGTPGSGQNMSLDITGPMGLRIGVKDVANPPEYPGGLPGGNILTAAMIAAGAIVDYGQVNGRGWFWRMESGLQFCISPALTMTYSSASILLAMWTFPGPFVFMPFVSLSPSAAIAANNMAAAKRGPSLADIGTLTPQTAQLRLSSSGLYTGGDETFGVYAFAMGLWKDPAG